ncbi:MAG: O-antigen ligase family protein [Candidatus Riflebacteria bacterium]
MEENKSFFRLTWLNDILFLLLTGIASLWFSGNDALLHSHGQDYVVMAVSATGFLLRKKNFSLNLLIMALSYAMHNYSSIAVGTFPEFYQASWLAICVFLLAYPEKSQLAIAYHLGLNFETSLTRTTGLGMQSSFHSANAIILLVAMVLHRLMHQEIVFRVDLRHIIALFSLIFLQTVHFVFHRASFTLELTALFGALTMFWMTSDARQRHQLIAATAFSGLLTVLISIGNVAILAESPGEIIRRRAWAAGAHPNKLATWAFACQLLLWLIEDPLNRRIRTAMRVFTAFLWIAIILSGARLILAIAILSHVLWFGRKLFQDRRTWLPSITLLILSLARFLQKFNWAELLKNERLMIWYSAVQNLISAPFTGFGAYPMSFLPQGFPEGSAFWIYDWNYPHAHQMLLELMLWGGVPLLLAGLAIIFLCLRCHKSPGYRFALFFMLATGLLDFAWGSPAMLSIATFMLFFPFQPLERGSRPLQVARILVLPAFLAAFAGLFAWQAKVQMFDKGTEFFAKGIQGWIGITEKASAGLPEPFPAMHLQTRLVAAGVPGREILARGEALINKFPEYYAIWFLQGRILELHGEAAKAADCYARSLELEPRDLTGVRSARLMLCKLGMGESFQQNETLLLQILKRGVWGRALILNHPSHFNRLKIFAPELINNYLLNSAGHLIDKLFLIKNAAEWGIKVDLKLVAEFSDRCKEFPGWLQDELHSAILKIQFQEKFSREILVKKLETAMGPSTCRTIALIAIESGYPDMAIAAYSRHRELYNFRGKNYEDLQMQFFAARAFIKLNRLDEARNELDRIAAFDYVNPFIFELLGEIELLRNNREKAEYFWSKASRFALNSRNLPYFNHGPNDDNWPEGDHWSLMIEKTIRVRDPQAKTYCEAEWQAYQASLKTRIEGLFR